MEKILFFYLKTGGGHLAPAKAVSDWIATNEPNKADIRLIDGFEGASKILKWIIEDGYRNSQTKYKWVFESLYFINKLRPIAYLTSFLVGIFIYSILLKIIRRERPSKIVLFHFFLVVPIRWALKRSGKQIPTLTVVTDPFSAHPIWFLNKNQKFVVFSNTLKEYLTTIRKIDSSNIEVFPFTIGEQFSKTIEYPLVKKRKELLGINENEKVILILGGADGIPNAKRLLLNLAAMQLQSQIVLVCGRNTKLFFQSQKIKTHLNFSNLIILRYVDYVRELLAISEIVITKCGASTFMEILHSKKIPLVSSYIWEQEKGNVDYICNNQLGLYEPKPEKLAKAAKTILEEQEKKTFFVRNIEKLELANGTPSLSQFILNGI